MVELTDGALREAFAEAGDFTARQLCVAGQRVVLYAIDGLTSGSDISEYVVRPLLSMQGKTMRELYHKAFYTAVYNSVAAPCVTLEDAVAKLLNGFCLVLFPGVGGLVFEDKTGEKRSPSPPEVENTIKGPKDAFTETVRTNTSLLRRHLRTPRLKLKELVVGQESHTNVTVAYLEGHTPAQWTEKVIDRLEALEIPELLSPAAIEEYLTGARATAFPLAQYTQRPDKFAQGLLQGQVGVLVDGLPSGYLLPVSFGALMKTPEDRGNNYIVASFLRVLRYGALLISLFLPGLYIGITTFYPEMIPNPLLTAIIESKQNVPFPTVFEVLALLLAFELLQQAGLSLPQSIGQTLSIIGGLVVGTAAVEARLLSPAALIVAATAGISGFVLPGRELADALRLWRLVLAVCASFAGLFGMTAAFLALILRLSRLESLGCPYLAPFSRGRAEILRKRLKDME